METYYLLIIIVLLFLIIKNLQKNKTSLLNLLSLENINKKNDIIEKSENVDILDLRLVEQKKEQEINERTNKNQQIFFYPGNDKTKLSWFLNTYVNNFMPC